jgi:hypothetical protein
MSVEKLPPVRRPDVANAHTSLSESSVGWPALFPLWFRLGLHALGAPSSRDVCARAGEINAKFLPDALCHLASSLARPMNDVGKPHTKYRNGSKGGLPSQASVSMQSDAEECGHECC